MNCELNSRLLSPGRVKQSLLARKQVESLFSDLKWMLIRGLASREKNSLRSSSQDCDFVCFREEGCVFFD